MQYIPTESPRYVYRALYCVRNFSKTQDPHARITTRGQANDSIMSNQLDGCREKTNSSLQNLVIPSDLPTRASLGTINPPGGKKKQIKSVSTRKSLLMLLALYVFALHNGIKVESDAI